MEGVDIDYEVHHLVGIESLPVPQFRVDKSVRCGEQKSELRSTLASELGMERCGLRTTNNYTREQPLRQINRLFGVGKLAPLSIT